MTLPTFGSLVTLPTLLGRVASDPLVLFLWPCSLKNTSPRILFLVVACDPTYLFGRVASDHFLALAIPKHLPWPDLHSDRIWPYSPTCHRKHGFCVAGATISMPLRCSPLTLYMLVGKCQMAFVWQVQQFWCLWDDLPWPYTCLLGNVKWLLCGRCNNFDASEMFSPDPIHAGWEVSNGFCVAGATISMPLRCSPLTLYMLVGKGQMAFVWQVQQFRCLWDDFPWPYTCWLGRVKWLLCGRCNNCDASEMISPDPIHACWEGSNGFCVAGATISMPLRCSPLTLYMLVGKCQMAFVWQVQQFWCLWDDLPWPYTCLLGSVKWLLCGRCNNFDASEMFSPDPIHACWEGSNGFCVAGAAILMPLRWSPLRWRGNAIFQWFYLDYIGVDAHHFTGLPWCRCFFPCIMISGWKITHEFLPTEQGFLSRAMPFFLFRVKWSVWCVVWPYLCSALYMDQKVGRRPVVTWIIESMGCRGGENFDKRNVVESMGCRGRKIVIKGMFLLKGML